MLRQIAPDFFEYFAAMAPLLDADASLLCASSWNDNGQRGHVSDPSALLRTDFFPGLGWMLTAATWRELRDAGWPAAWWDDWLRLPAQRQGRQCVRPEVCRTFNFGARGASKGQFYRDYLQSTQLSDAFIPWTQRNLSLLAPDA
jgi:alpha-1,3-mannosyl-glycoprotein beta-1,2-N-acetylglucosaminyltransferase